ncbi:conserved hypothetical protein [Aspergillus udagawae]|uniref:Uncharacterized protein n=1 Tax=Aspergillus udagawae TaxID=91492 RepID=A0A8H3N0V5_9EURO|nr:conserved hypothetical protein [Aspergillus udagawae]
MSSPLGEPSPGIDLKENHTPRNNATVIALYILAIVAIALRVTARLKVQHASVLAADWLVGVALLFSGILSETQIPVTANLVCTIVGM